MQNILWLTDLRYEKKEGTQKLHYPLRIISAQTIRTSPSEKYIEILGQKKSDTVNDFEGIWKSVMLLWWCTARIRRIIDHKTGSFQ